MDEGPHNFNAGVVTKEATYESMGIITYTCSTCEYKKENIINKKKADAYTITWKNYDGSVLEIDSNVEYGVNPTYNGAKPTRPSSDTYTYTFIGWTPSISKVTSDQIYVATFSKQERTYTFTFDLDGGTSDSYVSTKTTNRLDKEDFFFDVKKEDYAFKGWSYNNIKIFDQNGMQINKVEMTQNMTFKAIFSKTNTVTLTTNNPEAGEVKGAGEYPFNSFVDLNAKANDGYVFVGWYVNDILVSNMEDYRYVLWSEDVTINAHFEPIVYKMEIESYNTDYGLVSFKPEDSKNIEYIPKNVIYIEDAKRITIVAYTKTDTRFLGWYDESDILISTNAVYSFLMPKTEYKLIAKWDYFKIDYVLDGETTNEGNPDHYTLDKENLEFVDPKKEDFKFKGWYLDEEFNNEFDISLLTTQNITLYPKFVQHEYTITFVTNCSQSFPPIVSAKDKPITINRLSVIGYIFEGWYLDSSFTTPFAITVMPDKDMTVYAKLQKNELFKENGQEYWYYGEYPQSSKKSTVTIISTTPDNDGYYLGDDGQRYAKDTTLSTSERYYKVEPIKWHVIGKTDRYYKLISVKVLDLQPFNTSTTSTTIDGKTIYQNNYEHSHIRKWLNETFYDSAFSSIEKTKILVTEVNNGASSVPETNNNYLCNDTKDKIYLYSTAQMDSFFPKSSSLFTLRKKTPTTYSTRNDSFYASTYWTRSPDKSNDILAAVVNSDGNIIFLSVSNTTVGVVPAMNVFIK